MRYIDLSKIDTETPKFRNWINKAQKATQELKKLSSHEERSAYINSHEIWKELKQILIDRYGNICWYSESDISNSYGEVDHFRPKNRSTQANGECILEDGYWWLAYDYLNYRLSCEVCNSPFQNGGKHDIFPLKTGVTPSKPFEKNEDEYLLIDPCNYRDTTLIGFDENGAIVALSSDNWERTRVNVSRSVYNWDRFNNGRKQVRLSCETALALFEIGYANAPDKMYVAINSLFALTRKNAAYASFAKQYIEFKIEGKPYECELKKILDA